MMFLILYPFLDQINIWMRRKIAYFNAYKELDSLSDKDLADMRINRYDIHAVVNDTVRKRIPSQSF